MSFLGWIFKSMTITIALDPADRALFERVLNLVEGKQNEQINAATLSLRGTNNEVESSLKENK